mmetsp:Transcript_105612/g.251778  ORF Transcript_105612/g.251778 Transcript_105612/m.251778 type:complete len:747 (-) Transcript_105612:124-2364(-)
MSCACPKEELEDSQNRLFHRIEGLLVQQWDAFEAQLERLRTALEVPHDMPAPGWRLEETRITSRPAANSKGSEIPPFERHERPRNVALEERPRPLGERSRIPQFESEASSMSALTASSGVQSASLQSAGMHSASDVHTSDIHASEQSGAASDANESAISGASIVKHRDGKALQSKTRSRDLQKLQDQLTVASLRRVSTRIGRISISRIEDGEALKLALAEGQIDEEIRKEKQRRTSLRANAALHRQSSSSQRQSGLSRLQRQSSSSRPSRAGEVQRAKSRKRTIFASMDDESEKMRENARRLAEKRAGEFTSEGQTAPPGTVEKMRFNLRRFVSSMAFEAFAGCIITSNAVIIGMEVEYCATSQTVQSPAWFQTLHLLYAIVFALELGLRMVAYGCDLYSDSEMFRWACLDSFIVVSSFVDLGLSWSMRATDENPSSLTSSGLSAIRVMRVLRISRLIRVSRLAKLMLWLKALRTLIHSIFVTLKSLIWALVLLALIMYVFAIILAQAAIERLVLIKDLPGDQWDAQDTTLKFFWGSLGDSVSTLFMSITGGISWQVAELPLTQLSVVWKVVFFLYMAFVMFAVLNVMTGVFCQSAIESAARDHDMVMQNVVQDKDAHMRKFRLLFQMLDLDDTGYITINELEERMEDVKVKTYFEALELNIDDVWTFFRLLDCDSGQEIDIEEFIFGCMRLRGNATALDLAKLMHSHAWIAKQQVEFMMFCEDKFAQLPGLIHAAIQRTSRTTQV